MKIGIIGLPKSGKTSIFNALTGQDVSTSGFNAKKAEPNVASVDVKDSRVDVLVGMYRPKKISCARFDVMDFVGMEKKEGQVFSPSELSLIKTSDALCIVLRNFEDDIIDGHVRKIRSHI
ncbi:MAG: GTPase [Thermodesulfobacteriota bacterium]|nr:GTPase [Thermodesulfobacteriota bacterium]